MTEAIHLRDDRGRLHRWPSPPRTIVSLVPSDTYSLVRLGAAARLVGRTRYCVEPAGEVEAIEMVGGTKDADVARIIELSPDVVVANQEENTKHDIEALEAAGLRVLVSFPKRVADGIAALARLARMLGATMTPSPARDVVAAAYHEHRIAASKQDAQPRVPAFVPIWMDPLMTINGDTYISSMLELVGAENVFADRIRRYPLAADQGTASPLSPEQVGDRDTRYPRVSLDEVVARQPQIVLLPDEPHAFTESDADVFRALPIPAAKNGQVYLCGGRDLMWYGARGIEGIARVQALIDRARLTS